MHLDVYRSLQQPADTKIVMLVLDGLGGVPSGNDANTELEDAATPHFDQLAAQGICGLHEPVGTGITPGSGPAHLGIFGYDPLVYTCGRGVLAAAGIGFDLQPGDVAARGNFCTVDDTGNVTDRRAGRISTEENQRLCSRLQELELDGVELFVEPVKEHRFLLVLRGKDLVGEVSDTDPQRVGKKPLPAASTHRDAQKTVEHIQEFVKMAGDKLADEKQANMVLLRGFSERPEWPSLKEIFGIRAAAIAGYPMYRGLASLLGMDVLEVEDSLKEQITVLENHWDEYDFFYVHVKKTDSSGEDGDRTGKIELIEKVDDILPGIMALAPDVVVVTGDHATPSILKSHSWHAVPALLWSKHCAMDSVEQFGERACMAGGLGARFPATDLMPLAVANAMRLKKYGA